MKIIRVLKPEKCSECEKIGTWSKHLCQACYSKSRRQTPEGKKAMKLYNDTKGKFARERYNSKKLLNPPKEKKICDCGKVSIAKNLCSSCYQKKRTNKNYIYNPKEKNIYNYNKVSVVKNAPNKNIVCKPQKKVIDYTSIFLEVIETVKKGYTIQKSCDIIGIDRTTLYNNMTPLQKKELKVYKLIGKITEVDDYDGFL